MQGANFVGDMRFVRNDGIESNFGKGSNILTQDSSQGLPLESRHVKSKIDCLN
jgi:hypothetical protein